MNRLVVLIAALSLCGCTVIPFQNAKLGSVCERTERPVDMRIKYKCSGKKLVWFQYKFDM